MPTFHLNSDPPHFFDSEHAKEIGAPLPSSSETHVLQDAGNFPNNPRLATIIYRNVVSSDEKNIAALFERKFAQNDWPATWRYTIYDFAHYHSTAHEVIGVFQGSATIRLGDTSGIDVTLKAGDIVIIPAGVAHQRLEGSPDFECVGAYPRNQKPDIMKGSPDERPAADQRIKAVRIPATDPFFGAEGLLPTLW